MSNVDGYSALPEPFPPNMTTQLACSNTTCHVVLEEGYAKLSMTIIEHAMIVEIDVCLTRSCSVDNQMLT
jgi:hypothetical protein